MKTLNERELELTSGGMNIFGPASLAMTETWGPVSMAFGAGYAFGSFLYNNRSEIYAAFARAGVQTVVY
jgi:hypothetical protein